MTHLSTARAAVKPVSGDTPGERDLMLSALRVASARARLIANQIDTIGAGLRQKAITCSDALEWARQEDVIGWIQFGPEAQS
jgi:hypothetical protein